MNLFKISIRMWMWLLIILFLYTKQTQKISNCKIFPDDNIWNVPVNTLPKDLNSDLYIQFFGASNKLKADFGQGLWNNGPIGIPINVVSGKVTPKYNISFTYSSESDKNLYPISNNYTIEGGRNSTGDRHVLIFDTDICKLYELYYVNESNGNWTAVSGAIWDLNSNNLRTETWTSADAAGLPITVGLVSYDEVKSGEITHAIRITAPQTRKAYFWPATHFASSRSDIMYLPMGIRFLLRADYECFKIFF